MSLHSCYATMFDYITSATERKPPEELDPAPWVSPGHPEHVPAAPAHLQYAWRAVKAAAGQGKAPGRFGVLEFYDFLKAEGPALKTKDDLWRRAREEDQAGRRSLLKFLLSRNNLPDLLVRVSLAEGAAQASQRQRASRMDILRGALQRPCTCTSPEQWLQAASEVERLNHIENQQIQLAVLDALTRGRAKQRNIFIVGDTNRAKSFLLRPLEQIFKAYTQPDSGSHQLADLQTSEILWLNDFSWAPTWLPWSKLKDFLEGSALKVAVPKTLGSNYVFTDDAPVFGTSPAQISHPTNAKETEQMNSRIRYFTLFHYFDPKVCPDIKPCSRCCAAWLLAAQR